MTLLFVGGVGYLLYRSRQTRNDIRPSKHSTPVRPPSNPKPTLATQGTTHTRAFTRPIIVELQAVAHIVDWAALTPSFENWLLGYLAGHLLNTSERQEPLAILGVGMWSQQAGWERLATDTSLLIDVLSQHDEGVANLGLVRLKSRLTEYLIADDAWITGARDGVQQAKEWNARGSLAIVAQQRWFEYGR